MARSRNIKPGFFKNEHLVELDFATRLLFAGLWTQADREGRLEDRPKKIKMEVFPADDVPVDSMLDALQSKGFITRYKVVGQCYIQINQFLKHQAPHGTEKDSVIPDQDGNLTIHKRGKNGYATGEAQFIHCGLTVKDQGKNALIPDSLIPDSLIPESSSLRSERDVARTMPDPARATQCSANFDTATPCNTTQHQETPRGEESREEEIREGDIARTMPDPARATTAGIACFRMKAVGLSDTSPSHPKLLALLAAGISLAELVDAARAAVAGRKGFAYALATAEGRRRDAAMQPLPQARASPGTSSEPHWRAEQRARVQQFAPSVAAKPLTPQSDFIDVEAKDAIPDRLA